MTMGGTLSHHARPPRASTTALPGLDAVKSQLATVTGSVRNQRWLPPWHNLGVREVSQPAHGWNRM